MQHFAYIWWMPKSKKLVKRLTINITEQNFLLLEEMTTLQERSFSWLVGQAIELYLQKMGKKDALKSIWILKIGDG